MKKVKSGDPLVIPAPTYNAFVDAAVDQKRRQQASSQTERAAFRQAGIVLVKNGSGADRLRFDVLGIDTPVITPTDNENAFKSKVVLNGSTPSESDHLGRFVILLEPLAGGKVGMACAAGVCAVHIDVQNEDHRFADIKDGEAASLESRESGAATILWKEPGTGLKWAVVHVAGAVPPALFPVTVTKDGGEAGDAGTDCSFTYTVKDLAGFELETALSPECGRLPKTEYAEVSAESAAVAYRDASGGLHLYHVAGEVPVTKLAEVVTSFRYDTTTHAFQLKKTSVPVLEKADEDTEWTDVVALTECDDT
ncbi:MAG: hypothetical protein JXL80_00295 [Planctomycetes bacterium]|nr:hypothetical protein [Planctomycetota bacterium]